MLLPSLSRNSSDFWQFGSFLNLTKIMPGTLKVFFLLQEYFYSNFQAWFRCSQLACYLLFHCYNFWILWKCFCSANLSNKKGNIAFFVCNWYYVIIVSDSSNPSKHIYCKSCPEQSSSVYFYDAFNTFGPLHKILASWKRHGKGFNYLGLGYSFILIRVLFVS